MFTARHEFDNTTVERSAELLKLTQDYPTYEKEGRIFSVLCTGFDRTKGLLTDIGITIPLEHVSLKFHNGNGRDIEALVCVGRYIQFKFIKGAFGYIPSRYAVQKEVYDSLVKARLGLKVSGAIHNVSEMGLFVDVGAGVTALIPLKYICTSHTLNIGSRAKEGESFTAFLHSIENGRIVLNSVPMYGTFAENAARFKKGIPYPGRVTAIHDYGMFIELANNYVGLTSTVLPNTSVGEVVSVVVTDTNEKNCKVTLKVTGKSTGKPDSEPVGYASLLCGVQKWVYSPKLQFEYEGRELCS